MSESNYLKLEFRKATLADIDVAKQVSKAAIHHQCPSHYSPEHVAAWTAEPYPQAFTDNIVGYCYLVLLDGRVVGSGGLILPAGEIDSFFVLPDFMGQGIGKAIMVFLEQLAVANGLTTLTLESTLNAVPFYQSRGFISGEMKKYTTAQGIELDCVPMQKNLQPPTRAPKESE